MPRRVPVPALVAVLGLAATAALTGCSGSSAESAAAAKAEGKLAVVASFYPLQYAVEQIGGAHVAVTSLTKPGAEPHDVELTPQDVATVSTASLVVYADGFQPAVDEAVAQEASDHAFDVAGSADLTLAAPAENGQAPAAGAKDPHFWLDPQRYAAVATAIGARLAALDPDHAASYRSGTSAFVASLTALDTAFRDGLRTCQRRQLVTSHAAFGYLAQRYGFTQVPITGLDPEVEPSAQDLGRVADVVRADEVTTIYAETLVEPKFADTVARSTGATVATLDPLEGLTSASKGSDYREVMRSNLAALRTGQGCS